MRILIAAILWFILFTLCWPLAIVCLFLFPIVWLIALPFRIVGLSIELIFRLVGAILMFPFRVFRAL
jgi:hypothetical protein